VPRLDRAFPSECPPTMNAKLCGAAASAASGRQDACTTTRTKKADVAEHPKVFDHVGLLSNEPPKTPGLLFI
jgi:hypothetical protein